MRVEAVPPPRVGVRRLKDRESPTPSVWQHGRREADALGVVAIRLVEPGQFADRTIDQVGLLVVRVVEEGEVRFDRRGRLRWQVLVGDRAEDRLAADHEDVALAGDRRSRSEDMLELRAIQVGSPRSEARKASRTAVRSSSLSTPANGEFWRRSMASEDVDVSVVRTASGP